ncbi:MAG: hypothetical protein WBA44_09905 [Mesorhizobium sp.]
MLAPNDNFRCIECGKSQSFPGFAFYHGEPELGPAYYSDRGVLCSPACSLAHFSKRRAEGTMPQMPVKNPITGEFG